MPNGFRSLIVCSIFCSLAFPAMAAPKQKISNLEEVRQALNWSARRPTQTPRRAVRVAVLDKGFSGAREEIGRTLPAGTRIFDGPVAPPADLDSDHGLRMAQIVTALVTDDLRSPERLDLRLYNTFGFSNFQASISRAIADKVDIVLYSEVWEYGGNLDGRGFINAEVDRAVKAGILWFNAAGNFAKTTYNSAVKTGAEDWVDLPDTNRALKLVCQAPQGRKCAAKVVLSWNDFKNSSEPGTNKDLDLALTDDLLNIRRTSTLRQSADAAEARPGYTKYPREIVSDELEAGTYYIRVKNSSKNFGAADRLRVSVDGEFLELPSADKLENLPTPADNPGVVTVGALDSDRSSRSVRLGKPDVSTISSIKLEDGSEFRGSSNSAAIAASVGAMTFLQRGSVDRKTFLALHAKDEDWSRGGLSLSWLRFGFTGPGCFIEGSWPEAPRYLAPALEAGGRFVQTTSGWRIMTSFDPATLARGHRRIRADDMLTLGPAGWRFFPRNTLIPEGAVEVFQRPLEAGLCGAPSSPGGRVLR